MVELLLQCGGYALGTERFHSEVGAMLGRRAEPGVSGRPTTDRDKSPPSVSDSQRQLI